MGLNNSIKEWRKGNWAYSSKRLQADIIVGMVYFFATILVLWILTLIWQTSIFGNAQVASQLNPSGLASVTNTINGASGFFTGINTIIAFLYIFICIGAVVSAAFTEAHPVFAVIGIMFLPVEIILAFGFHDAFFAMINNSVFNTLVAQYPFVSISFQYLPIVTLALAFVVMLATFAKSE